MSPLPGFDDHLDNYGDPAPGFEPENLTDEQLIDYVIDGTEPLSAEQIRANVLKLWDDNDGWIPGVDYARLAAALGVPPERTQSHRHGGQSRPNHRPRNITFG
jgi:hypothetical protein